ncbi:hypothetical protein VNO80_12983 [Phaseolus coccineus]|uniref:Secreted protein n=1 Tax=Phaseolus coccineus TaxID=3886 RepID=A0AAN9N0C7_PHACN
MHLPLLFCPTLILLNTLTSLTLTLTHSNRDLHHTAKPPSCNLHHTAKSPCNLHHSSCATPPQSHRTEKVATSDTAIFTFSSSPTAPKTHHFGISALRDTAPTAISKPIRDLRA